MLWIVVSISLVSLYLLSPGAREVTDIEKKFSDGVNFYNEKKDSLALEKFIDVIEAAPNLPRAKELMITSSLFNAGCCKYRLKEYDYAIEYFSKLSEEFPSADKSQDALFYLGDLYLNKEDYDNAIESYQAYIELKPDNIDAIIDTKLQIALCYGKKIDPEGTLKVLESLEAEYPGQLLLKQKCDHVRFVVYELSEQMENAVKFAEEIIKQEDNPWTNDVCFRAGNFFFEKEQYSKAIDFYQKVMPKADEIERIEALEERAKEKKVYKSDFSALGYKHWEESTLNYLAKGVENNPDFVPHALYQIGRCHFLLADNIAAKETYLKILEEYSEEEELVEKTSAEIGICYLKDGDIESFKQSISKIETDDVKYNFLYGLRKEKFYEVIISQYEKGKFVFEDEENASAALYLIADAYYEVDDFSTALKLFDEVTEKFPESEQINPAKFRAGQCLLKLKQYQQVLQLWNELIGTYEERKPEITYMLAYTYLNIKDYQNSIDYSNRFFEEFSEHELVPETRLCRGSAMMGQKKYDQALADFHELLENYPENELVPTTYANIGRIYYYQEKFAQMTGIFLKLKEEYPEDLEIQAEARYWLGLGDERENKYKSAISKYKAILELYPESEWVKEAQLRNGYCYVRVGQYELATKSYLAAIDGWWQDEGYLLRVLEDLNIMFWHTSEYERAIRLYEQLIKEYGDVSDYLSFKLAGIYYYMGNDQEATTIYKRILHVLPKDIFSAQDRYMIGEVFLRSGHYRGALDNYLTFITEIPPPPQVFCEEAIRGVAYCYFRLVDPSIGKKLKELIKSFPYAEGLPEVSLALGEMNRLKEEYNQAIPFYLEAMRKLTDDELIAMTLFGLGECYRRLGNYEEAALYYKRLDLLYGFYTDLAERARRGFEECNKHL